ncbi:MAG TPA: hypothetical protein VMR86_16235 [Myxococcota bacterium]|nr:hypothetical protein [Myxococcota bacterium]
MRKNRFVSSLGFCVVLVACARLASAQTYIWTDDRGVVHAAADPSEVPAQYRQKAVENASKSRPAVKIVPEDQVPAAPAPSSPRAAQKSAPAPEPRSFEGEGTSINAHPELGPGKAATPTGAAAKGQAGPHGLPPADPGFEWQCLTDPEGGPPHCRQEEKKYHKRARRAQARENAQKQLGIQPGDETDPDVAKKVNQRAQEEFDKTTPEPSNSGEVRPNVEDESGSESVEQSDD